VTFCYLFSSALFISLYFQFICVLRFYPLGLPFASLIRMASPQHYSGLARVYPIKLLTGSSWRNSKSNYMLLWILWLVFGVYPVRISVLINVFRCCPQILQATAGIIPQITPRSISSAQNQFIIHCHPVIRVCAPTGWTTSRVVKQITNNIFGFRKLKLWLQGYEALR
jgi:hypothetical protein